MFWGCITHEGVGTFVPVDGTINSENYIQILDHNLWPVAAKHFPQNPWIFQDDNATHPPFQTYHSVEAGK
jgi:Zn/Cd-binding protein ZinT